MTNVFYVHHRKNWHRFQHLKQSLQSLCVSTPRPNPWEIFWIVFYHLTNISKDIAFCLSTSFMHNVPSMLFVWLSFRNVLLLHDNGRSHTAVITQQSIKNLHRETLKHPPYSPDMSPSDYHLFGSPNEALSEEKFENDIQVKEFMCITRPTTFFKTGITKLPVRW